MNNIITMAIGLGGLSLGAFYFLGVDKVETEDIQKRVTDAQFDNVERALANSKPVQIPTIPKKRTSTRNSDPSPEACQVGPIELGAQVHFVSAYEGNALSNIDFSQGETPTEVATLRIEPGDTPLVIVASSYRPVIWKFTGSTERISNVVLAPKKPDWSVGSIGIAAHQLKVLGPKCLPRQKDVNDLRKLWKKQTGLSPDAIQSVYSVNRLSLPSGHNLKSSEARKLRESETNTKKFRYGWRNVDMRKNDHDVFKYNPEGVYILDKKDIVASGPVNKVKILPGRAGIAQLASRKKIIFKDGVYHVRKKFSEYPSGLYGAHRVTFIFPDKMQLPNNSPGHSKVIRKSDYTKAR